MSFQAQASLRWLRGRFASDRSARLAVVAAGAAGLLASPAINLGATKTLSGTTVSNGIISLTTAGNWTASGIPGSGDEADVPSAYTGTGSLGFGSAQSFGNFLFNKNSAYTVGNLTSTSSNYVLTLSTVPTGTQAVADGGSQSDLILLGTNVTSQTVTFSSANIYTGTGTLGIALAAGGNFDVVNSGATLSISSVFTGAFAVAKTGAGTLVLSSNTANSFTGFSILGGTVSLTGNTFNVLGSVVPLTFNGGTLALNNTALGTTSRAVNLTGAGTVSTALGVSSTFSGVMSGAGNFTKTGPGSLTLSNAGNALSGATTLSGGTLNLTAGATVGTGALTLGSTTLALAANHVAESFASTTIASVPSLITSTTLVDASTNIAFGGISRSASGGAIDFALPTVGNFTSTTLNINGIVGGYATASGISWLSSGGTGSVAGNLTPLATYETSYAAASSVSNFDVLTSDLFANTSVNTVRFNNPVPTTATLNGAFSVATGGILVTSAVGANSSTLSGGTSLTSGNGQDLIVHQFNTAGSLTIATPIVGSIGLTKTGPGNLTLTATNTFTGPIIIGAGTLQVGDGTANGTLSNSGFTANILNNGNFTYARPDSTTYSGVISGTGGLTVLNGTLTLTASSSFSGVITIAPGATLSLGSGGTSGNTPSASSIVNNGTLIVNRAAATITLVPGAMSGSGSFVKNGASSWTFPSNNTYSGTTTVNLGTLAAGSGTSSFSPNSDFFVQSPAILDMNGFSNTIKSLSGDGTVSNIGALNGAPTLTIFAASGTTTFSGTLVNGGTKALSLAKSGASTQILTGASTYTGTTTVKGGVLAVNNTSGSGTGTGAVTVGDGTNPAILAGTGTIAGTLSILNAATISPGARSGSTSIIGTLSAGANVTFNDGSLYEWQLTDPGTGSPTNPGHTGPTGGGVYDKLAIAGGVTPGTSAQGTSVLLSIPTGGITPTPGTFYRWQIASAPSGTFTPSVVNTFKLTFDSSILLSDQSNYSLDYSDDGTGLFVATGVPEPSIAAISGIASAGLLLSRRRSRKRQ